MVKAIETKYNGYKFRSRLEARWAVFFDALGIPWEYEPEGFDLGDGLFYLPDFRLQCWGTRGDLLDEPFDLWVEVKGVMTEKDAKKIRCFVGERCFDMYERPVLILGNIPTRDQLKSWNMIPNPYTCMNGTDISAFNYELIDGDYFGAFPAAYDGKMFLWGHEGTYIWNEDHVYTSLDKARQAQFEFGAKL